MLSTRRQNYFMRLAQVTADQSYAEKLKVGAVAVLDDRPICTGYNGTPPGEDNCCEEFVPYAEFCDDVGCPQHGTVHVCGRLVTKPDVEHAERNLIYFAARKGIRLEGASLFITHSPCLQCARAIIHAGFRDVYYRTAFNDLAGLEWLGRRIKVHQVQPNVPTGMEGQTSPTNPEGSHGMSPDGDISQATQHHRLT